MLPRNRTSYRAERNRYATAGVKAGFMALNAGMRKTDGVANFKKNALPADK